MNELRNNIESLKHDYSSLKYPGDLASDVPLESDRPMLLRFAPVLALAAAVAVAATVWVMTRSADPIGVSEQIAQVPPAAVDHQIENGAENSIAEDDQELPTLAEITVPESHTITAPSWSGISSGGFSASMVSMPAQSMSIPTVVEIDNALATNTTNSDI